MPNIIEKLMAQVTKLDMWTQLSILGAWQFLANASCINQGMKFIPDTPKDSGIEHFTDYEASRKKLIDEAETSPLPALITLQRDIAAMTSELGGDVRELEDTYQWLTREKPSVRASQMEYEQRRRQGIRVDRKLFVEADYKQKMEAYEQLIAKGEDAIRLCDTVTISGLESNLPDWVPERFQEKMIEKLHDRWLKLEMNRTKPRRKKEMADGDRADQLLIEALLDEYGETIPDAPAEPITKEDDWLSKAGELPPIADLMNVLRTA